MADQELKLTAVAQGFDQAAGEVAKVTDAEKQLADAASQSGVQTKLSGEQFRELQSILNDLHPGLGRLAAGFSKALDLAGSLGTSNVKLGGVLKTVTETIKANASALLLIGAGGAVVFGINAIVAAIQKMGEESKKATQALKQQREALDEIFRGRAERQQEIENVSDTRRRAGGLSAEASARAVQSAEAIGKRFTALDAGSVNQAVGTFADLGLDDEQLAQAAFLIQSGELKADPASRPENLRRQFERSLSRNRERVGAFFARETSQGQGSGIGGAGQTAAAAGAIREARNAEGGTVSLEDFIRNLPGGLTQGLDPKRLAAIVQGVEAIRGEPVDFGGVPQGLSNILTDRLVRGQSGDFFDLEAQTRLLGREGIEARPEEIRIAEFVLQQLQKAGHGPGGTVNIPMPNARIFGTDAAAFERRSKYGEKRDFEG